MISYVLSWKLDSVIDIGHVRCGMGEECLVLFVLFKRDLRLYILEVPSVRPTVSRVASIRQRSRSGDSSPVCLSQQDIVVANGNITMAIASSAIKGSLGMIRSSSDSNILMESEKHKGNVCSPDLVVVMVVISGQCRRV